MTLTPDTESPYASAVAIVGMSGRFPGSDGVAEFWQHLCAGQPGLRELDDQSLLDAGASPSQLADPHYVRWSGAVANPDLFDAALFGINPREAALMDPQHRMFLECSWEALESSGHCPTDAPGQVGVFAGCGFPDYIAKNLTHLAGEPGVALQMAVGNERDSLASLVSYKLGLRGPALGIQTFCSTSLVAVHLACQSLLTYECDLALAGGAFVPLPQPSGYLYAEGGILSPDGVVRSFDARANGTVMGSGVGVVTLKRAEEAIADGDVIHALVLGSAVNNDGRARVGYTAPGVDGESEVIEQALGVAGVKPETVGYVECHATGTSLGDSIEIAALNRVFGTARDEPCVLGTLKPSIGHLDRASGVAGLIRASLNLKHRVLPGTPNYRSPNPALVGAEDRFEVLTADRAWPEGPDPRRAGVSSFGLGGTNAHVVLEEAPPPPARTGRPGPHLLVLSAQDEVALDEATQRLRAHLAASPHLDLADVAFTQQVSRGGFALRRAVVCSTVDDAVAALDDPSRWLGGTAVRRNPTVVITPSPQPTAWLAQLAGALSAPGVDAPADVDAAQVAGLLAAWLTDRGVSASVDVVSDSTHAPLPLSLHPDGLDVASWLQTRLAELWITGVAADWTRVHAGEGRRVELPTYPFQRRRHWVEPVDSPTAVQREGKTFDRSQWTYLPTWRQEPVRLDDLDTRLREAGPWLVLSADDLGDGLATRLRHAGAEVTVARPAPDAPATVAKGHDAEVRVADAGDLTAVLRSMPQPPRAVVHGFSLADREDAGPADFHTRQESGFLSALALATALVDTAAGAPRTQVALLTSGAVHLSGGDLRHPEHATLAALAPSVAQENPRVLARHVDVATRGDAPSAAEIDLILGSLVSPHRGPVAIRGEDAWTRAYQHHPVPEPDAVEAGVRSVPVQPRDRVLITGGLGDVGVVLARHLARRHGCRLVLTARTPLPPRADWDRLLGEADADPRAVRHVRTVLALEAEGIDVVAMTADVADHDAMQRVVDVARERFGGLDVVVHAAGVQDGRHFQFTHQVDPASVRAHFEAKVDGFHVLQSVLGEEAPDRRLAFSSLAGVLGGMTLGVYAAANAALDAYALTARQHGAGRWVSVDWDTWNVDPDRVSGHSASITDFAMTPAEAADTFERTLEAGRDVARLVISTGPLDPRVEQWVVSDLHGDEDVHDVERHPRPALSTPFEEPAAGTESRLAELWSGALAISPVGALDNFFDLGGHSLIAMDLTHRIRAAFEAQLPVTGLLECPTVRELGALIDSLLAVSDDPGGATDGAA
ncbi:type I polyketide synthase [Nocardioides sp. GXZ039]|uniref:type I polyketide synthase n=1 Tax=Nocardioides sp. GXZ039 TaxID=3136018 RepID=UPI0030F43D10